jgi:cAMP-dependent protein kinase regulator
MLPKDKAQRYAVSAEVYGDHNKKGDFVPKVIIKDEDQIKRIRVKLEKAFMFQHLDEKEKEIVINAMEEKLFKYYFFKPCINPLVELEIG